MRKFLAITLAMVMICSVLPVFAASQATSQNFSTETLDDEVIFHYKDAFANGTWKNSTAIPNYDGGDHIWTNVKGNTLVYTITGIKNGNYEAYTWVLPHKFNVDKQEYIVNHNGKTSNVYAYQKIDETETVEPGWVSLGVLDFSGNGKETFTLTCPGDNVRGSAIKLVPTKAEVTEVKEEVEEVKESAGSISDAVYISGKPEKMNVPNSGSQLKDVKLDPMGTCKYVGEWAFSSAVSGPMVNASNSMWIAAANTNSGKVSVTYNPDISAVGDVNIFVYLLYWHENQNPAVKYEVHHNGKVDTIVLDPTKLTESAWVNLGTFDFAGNSQEEYVKLIPVYNDNTTVNTRASTMMFEIVNTEGGIWQTRYVTPVYNADEAMEAKLKILASFDKFDDMKDHWANYDVEYMANEGLVSGVADNLFDPEANITRAEYLTILDRAMGYELINGESYPDVAQDQWYAPYVTTAKANDLIAGLPTDDGFKPEQPITREEMALFAYNAIKATKKNDAWVATMQDVWGNFSDTAEVSDWAKEALQYLIKTEIIKGTSETTVSPKANATRAQGAVILKRFMQLFVWAGPPANQEWTLMFNDEFQGTEMNWSVWRSEASAPGHIQSSRWPENVEVYDGALHLVVRKEERGGKEWTAGSVWVRPEVFAQTYGYWEARYKIAYGTGINNSFWTCTSHAHNIHMDPDTRTWFELDINEGHYPNEVATNYHTWVTGESKQNSKVFKFEYDLSKDYHTYALEWTPEKFIYYFDGVVIRELENLNAHQLQYPYLSSAVLNWAGQITDASDGTAQVVDYVRIWQTTAKATDETLNFKGEPMVGVGPSEQGTSSVVSPTKKPDVNEETDMEIPKVTVKEQAIDNETYANEIIIPAEVEGAWKESTFAPNYDGGAHKWSNTPGDKLTCDLSTVPAGKYKIYMWRLPHQFNVEQMDMMLSQNGKDALVGSLALKLAEGETAESGWVLIGEQEIKGGAGCQIYYTCTGLNCRATAIKLVPVN